MRETVTNTGNGDHDSDHMPREWSVDGRQFRRDLCWYFCASVSLVFLGATLGTLLRWVLTFFN